MVLTLDPDAMNAWAAAAGQTGKSYQELVALPAVHEMVEGYIKELNSKLNRWETVKKFTILPRDFAVETGELTPSLKVKRKVVETTFSPQIESMYAGSLAEV
jgi:long-chain acyl-CoA synthetase